MISLHLELCKPINIVVQIWLRSLNFGKPIKYQLKILTLSRWFLSYINIEVYCKSTRETILSFFFFKLYFTLLTHYRKSYGNGIYENIKNLQEFWQICFTLQRVQLVFMPLLLMWPRSFRCAVEVATESLPPTDQRGLGCGVWHLQRKLHRHQHPEKYPPWTQLAGQRKQHELHRAGPGHVRAAARQKTTAHKHSSVNECVESDWQ